jgi:hypothetical protein
VRGTQPPRHGRGRDYERPRRPTAALGQAHEESLIHLCGFLGWVANVEGITSAATEGGEYRVHCPGGVRLLEADAGVRRVLAMATLLTPEGY